MRKMINPAHGANNLETTKSSDNLKIGNTIVSVDADQLEKSITLVKQAYAKNPSMQNGFGDIANEYCAKGQYEIALKLYERDCRLNRMSPDYRHIYSYLLAQFKREKESLSEITRACEEDPSLRYGYLLVDRFSGKLRFGKDKLNRVLDNEDKKVFWAADILNQSQNFDQWERWAEAETKVSNAYKSDLDLRDGYAFIGSLWKAFVQYEKALYYYELDRSMGRLTPVSRIVLANILTRFGKINEAKNEVIRAYSEFDTLCDGFAVIGSVYRNIGKHEEALPYYERDRSLNRLTPENRHILADQLAREGRLKEAEDEVLIGYSENPAMQNGYARIGNILRVKCDFKTALKYYERDWEKNRLSPIHRVIFAELLAIFGKIKEAEKEIKIGYSEYLHLTDGYSRCAWAYYWPRKNYEKVIELCELDYGQGRLTYNGMLRMAQSHAAQGEIQKALYLVGYAYKENHALNDGYARCALLYYWPREEFEKVIELYEIDNKQKRLTPNNMLGLAQAYAIIGEIQKAFNIVKCAYAEDNTLCDGYARCAWQHYWPRSQYEKVVVFSEKDNKKNRLTPAWMLNLAQAYAACDEIDKAMILVEKAYKADLNIADGYARCAFQFYWSRQAYCKLIEMFEKDKRMKRLSPHWVIVLAQAYAIIGDIVIAKKLVEKAYNLQPSIKDGYVRCAWYYFHHFLNGKDLGLMTDMMTKDLKAGKISPYWKLNLARGYADNGEIEKAEMLVDQAYSDDSLLKDGYASLAFSRHNHSPILEKFRLIEKDLNADRLSDNYRQKAKSISRAIYISKHLSYNLPTMVVSFPRSGSNFMQKVIQDSSGLICQSIYSPELLENGVLNLKTHSPSPEYLIDEWKTFFKSDPVPEKLIILNRDPRDIVISFYEFFKFRRNIDVSQRHFLHQIDYFYATFIERRIYLDGLSICQAYKKFIENWWVPENSNFDILKIRYEDLVINPIDTFSNIFRFLDLNCQVSTASLDEKVSLYSPDKRPRGLAYGWKSMTQQYAQIIMQSQECFEKEISMIGNSMS